MTPTDGKPTMAGIHLTSHKNIGMTLRFADGLYYKMSPTTRKAGQIPITKKVL